MGDVTSHVFDDAANSSATVVNFTIIAAQTRDPQRDRERRRDRCDGHAVEWRHGAVIPCLSRKPESGCIPIPGVQWRLTLIALAVIAVETTRKTDTITA